MHLHALGLVCLLTGGGHPCALRYGWSSFPANQRCDVVQYPGTGLTYLCAQCPVNKWTGAGGYALLGEFVPQLWSEINGQHWSIVLDQQNLGIGLALISFVVCFASHAC